MEQEFFFTGYCRAIDQSRLVAVVTENGCFAEADCQYATCPYAPNCPIGQQIRGTSQ